jgi:hypothetical protein
LIKPRNGGNKIVNKKETTIMLKCDCGCSILVVDREEWADGIEQIMSINKSGKSRRGLLNGYL